LTRRLAAKGNGVVGKDVLPPPHFPRFQFFCMKRPVARTLEIRASCMELNPRQNVVYDQNGCVKRFYFYRELF